MPLGCQQCCADDQTGSKKHLRYFQTLFMTLSHKLICNIMGRNWFQGYTPQNDLNNCPLPFSNMEGAMLSSNSSPS